MEEMSGIRLDKRSELCVYGASAVLNFTERETVLQTDLGVLAVTGEGLEIDGFDKEKGTVTVKGRIDAMFYPSSEKNKTSVFKRLFG